MSGPFKMKGWSPFTQKEHEVKPREGTVYVGDQQFSDKPMYEGHKPSTHLMAYGSGEGGKFHAWPTLFQSKEGVWSEGGIDEAVKKGEVYEFDTEEEAKAFAGGSWKDKHFNK